MLCSLNVSGMCWLYVPLMCSDELGCYPPPPPGLPYGVHCKGKKVALDTLQEL